LALDGGLAARRAWDVKSENRPQREQFAPGSPPHSPAMGPEDGAKWAAADDLQPTIPKPDGLLEGGTDGMDFIRSLLAQAAAHLQPEGVLVLEVGHERAHFERAFPGLPAHWLHTSAGPDAVLLLTRAALEIWQSTLTDPTRRTPA